MKLDLLVLVVVLVGCSSDCPALPCPLSMAIELTATSATTGAVIRNPTIVVNGDSAHSETCDSVCIVQGEGGKYDIEVRATGFVTATRTVTVQNRAKTGDGCGCTVAETQDVTVALTATP